MKKGTILTLLVLGIVMVGGAFAAVIKDVVVSEETDEYLNDKATATGNTKAEVLGNMVDSEVERLKKAERERVAYEEWQRIKNEIEFDIDKKEAIIECYNQLG